MEKSNVPQRFSCRHHFMLRQHSELEIFYFSRFISRHQIFLGLHSPVYLTRKTILKVHKKFFEFLVVMQYDIFVINFTKTQSFL